MSSSKYDGSKIEVLKGLEAVRKRPGMYIGDTDKKGLHHLIYEILDNSVDEAIAGYCKNIVVTLQSDGETISVEDDGRGIPVDIHPTEGKSSLEVVMTTLHAGGKMTSEEGGYMISGGLHGVGASCVTALSDSMTVDVYREGYLWQQTYSKGIPTSEVKQVKKLFKADKQHGTCVTWHADPSIFKKSVKLDSKEILKRLRETAFLMKGLSLTFVDKTTNTETNFKYDGGIKDYVLFLSENKNGTYPRDPIFCSRKHDNIDVEFSILWNEGDDEILQSYANNIHTVDGGTHLSGFKTSLTRTINKLGREKNFLKEKDDNLDGKDILEGICCVLNIKLSQPEFVGQTKAKLGTVEAESVVSTVVSETLTDYFNVNEKDLSKIVQRAQISQRARKAAKDAASALKKKSFLGQSGRIPEKLKDCRSDDLTKTELFIVEGSSAAGSATQGRDSEYQAILAIKGKIINAEKCDVTDLLKNEEVSNLMIAIGTGIKDDFDIAKLRYGKIIIMCLHGDTKIRTLDGRNPSIKQLAEEGKKVWIWTRKGNEIVPILADAPFKTTVQNQMIKLLFDNGSEVQCTLDHYVMVNSPQPNDQRVLWKNNLPYIQAKDLTSIDSISHVIFNKKQMYRYGPTYETIKFFDSRKIKSTHFTHQYVYEYFNPNYKIPKYDIHHKDKNELNNCIENLEYLSDAEHLTKHFDPIQHGNIISEYHNSGKYDGTSYFIEYNKTEEHKENIKRNHVIGTYDNNDKFNSYNGTELQKENLKKNWQPGGAYTTPEYNKKLRDGIKASFNDSNRKEVIAKNATNQWNNPESKFKIATGKGFSIIDKILKNGYSIENITDTVFDAARNARNAPTYKTFLKNFSSVEDMRREYLKSRGLNTRLVSSTIIECENEQFYCFNIPETGNFVLENGVIVKNCDADDDGYHIRTLLLAFFYRYMKPLVENGNVYVAQPPLYMIESKNPIYCWTEEELNAGLGDKKYDVKRFKGLGEMNADQLAETSMKVGSRKLIQVNIEDAIECDRILDVLMGKNIIERKKHISKNLKV